MWILRDCGMGISVGMMTENCATHGHSPGLDISLKL